MTATLINNITDSDRFDILKHTDEIIKQHEEEKFIKDYENFVSGRNVLSNEEYKRQIEYFYKNQDNLLKLIKLRRDKKV